MNLRWVRWGLVLSVALAVPLLHTLTIGGVSAAPPTSFHPGKHHVVSHVPDYAWTKLGGAEFSACHSQDALGQYVRLMDRRTRWSVVVSVDGTCALPSGVDFGVNAKVAHALGVAHGDRRIVAVERVR